MKVTYQKTGWMLLGVLTMTANVSGQDWPQWRGPNRDAKAVGFDAPDAWPTELTQKWKVSVGEGVATPALVNDKLYVFSRQDGNEVFRCLDATTGKDLWHDQYAADGARGPARGFSGPRSSPTVADGKVVTLGVQGTLSCFDAQTGKLLWRNDDYEGSVPQFNPSSSPIVVDGLCIAHLGSERDGAIVAYDLATGTEKWTWDGDGPCYGSPALMEVGQIKAIVTPTASNMVAVSAADGKLLWKIPYSQGRYNAASPVVNGQTIVYAVRGTTAEQIELDGEELSSKELWRNSDNSLQFNTPVHKDGYLFGLSNQNSVFCINIQDGKTVWSAPLESTSASQQRQEPQDEQRGQRRQGRRRGRGGGRGGYGSIVDAGSVLLALTPSAQLVVFQPSHQEFKQLASYKISDSQTHAYPVVSGNRVFIKDQDAVTLWTIE